MDPAGQHRPRWSRDGRAVAYQGPVDGHDQVFVRFLDSPVPTQLTANRPWVWLLGWSPDSKRVLFVAPGPDSSNAQLTFALYSITFVGGEPEQLASLPDYSDRTAISPDGQTIAVYGQPKGEKATVFFSSPIGSAYRRYEPAPFTSSGGYNITSIRFSPDGKKLLLIRTGDSNTEEAWLLPYPPGRSPPSLVLTQFPSRKVTYDFSWMPDSRHVAIAVYLYREAHLWIADTESDHFYQISGGTDAQGSVDVSPSGKQIAYSEEKQDLDIASVSLRDGKSTKLIASDVDERMAAWAAKTDRLAFVTNRNGPMEIWVRSPDGSSHPLVTPKDFPGSATRFFTNPALSPDGEKVIFARSSSEGQLRTWIMSSTGGAPQRLNESATDSEWGGTWSSDGRRFAELAYTGGSSTLTVIKIGSREKPAVLRERVSDSLPDWSPTGEWVTFQDDGGWNLISPDGKTARPLGKIASSYLCFSKDGKLLYGIREEHDHPTLFSLDIATLNVTDIRELGRDLAPSSDYSPGIRFSLTPDGKSITYSTQTHKSNLWLLEGFRQPGLLSRLGLNWSN